MSIYRGHQAKIYFNGTILGYVRNVTVNIERNLEEYYEFNNRKVRRIIEGVKLITGKIEKAWIDTNFLSLLGADQLPTFELVVKVPKALYLLLLNCKFSKGSVTIPQDGFLTESYEFLAESCVLYEREPAASAYDDAIGNIWLAEPLGYDDPLGKIWLAKNPPGYDKRV